MFGLHKMNDSDLARQLQEEYDREAAVSLEEVTTNSSQNILSTTTSFNNKQKHPQSDDHSMPVATDLSPVDPSLEFSDPNPDIRWLFLQFNAQFFWSSLAGVEVKWSPRMTLCAGLCVYEGRGGLCSVRLSLPLLKLRPRKDLVETLLHEMIHAYLFVTHNDSDHSDHGSNFLSHMHRINKATGAKISVYHTFNDEVESYQQHWWRCSGPCQQRAPYYGFVKRSMNRAPSPRDLWWADHQASCGGVYTKVKEPEGYGQKKTGKGKPVDTSGNIQTLWGQGHILGSSSVADNKFIAREKTSANAFNRVKGATSSSLFNHVGRVISKSLNGFPSLPTVTKSSTSQSTNAATNGPAMDTTFKHSTSNHHANKHLTSTNFETKAFKQGTSKASADTFKEIPGVNLSTQVKKNSSDNGDNVIDLTFLDVTSPSPNNRISGTPGNKYHKTHGKHLSSSKKWNPTTLVRNKKVSFPKDFVSVCDDGDFSKSQFYLKKKKRKKKVYILDELDSNDGLWEESTASSTCDNSSSDNNNKAKTNAVSYVDKPAENMTKISDMKDSNSIDRSVVNNDSSFDVGRQKDGRKWLNESDNKKNTNGSSCSAKNKDQASGFHTIFSIGTVSSSNQSVSSEREVARFTGQGHKLGTRDGVNSFLSLNQKALHRHSDAAGSNSSENSHGSSSNKHFRESPIRQAVGSSPLSTKKRISVEAFGEQDSSDSDSVRTNKRERPSGPAAHMSQNITSNVPQRLVSELQNEAAGRSGSLDVKVPCPSCTIMVSLDGINAHLDLCLSSG